MLHILPTSELNQMEGEILLYKDDKFKQEPRTSMHIEAQAKSTVFTCLSEATHMYNISNNKAVCYIPSKTTLYSRDP